MKISLLIFSLLVLTSSYGQSNAMRVLIEKADKYLTEKEYDKASYYYNLAIKENSRSEPDLVLRKVKTKDLEKRILVSDSLNAYSSNDKTYLSRLENADNLAHSNPRTMHQTS